MKHTYYYLIKNLTVPLLLMLLTSEAYSQNQKVLDWLIDTSSLEGKHANGEHPRGLIKAEEVAQLRERVKREPFLGMFQNLTNETRMLEDKVAEKANLAYDLPDLALHYSYLYLLSGEEKWAQKALEQVKSIIDESPFFSNPYAFGLTRANMLQKMAITYDFCYQAWDQKKRDEVNRQLYKLSFSVMATMGPQANYSLVSNWMGVRWASVLLTSLVWDNPLPEEASIVAPLIWDSSKRLMDHLNEIMFENGWNAESMGYHQYNWSFIGPTIIAWQNYTNKQAPTALEQFAPNAFNTMWALSSISLPIETIPGIKGMKPDLSDDNHHLRTGINGMNFRLYPEAQIPALKWMHDYMEDHGIYSILYYPEEVKASNPEMLDWLTYSDPQQGVAVFRNRFKDENDIVAVFNTSATRVKGHQGPDVNTFRIIGLGIPWVIGAGRTGLVAGQTNLFPGPVSPQDKGNSDAGALTDFKSEKDGSGYASGKGSSTGVIDHKRLFKVDYSKESGTEAVFIIADSSQNGKIWRLNTPEFNKIVTDKDGFTITGPNGASLKGHVFGVKRPLSMDTGQVKYGGETIRHNTGINFKGKNYKYNNWIDVENEGDILVVLTLQPAGKSHPKVRIGKTNKEVIVGSQRLKVNL